MKKYYPYLKLTVALWIVYFLIKDFEAVRAEILSVLILWSGTLIPSLFPYLVLSGYLTSSGALTNISRFLFPLKKILSLSSDGIGVWLCSLFCGYPSGAVCTSELYSCGRISKNEAERLLCFTNNAGPLFLISAVGECMLGSGGDGVLIYIIQTLSALIAGIVLSLGCGDGKNDYEGQKFKIKESGKSFCECCQTSVNAMLMICAYAVTASVLGKVVLLSVNGVLIRFPEGVTGWIEGIVYGIFEISTAISKISALNRSSLTVPVICALVSWSGLSVILQIKSVISPELTTKKLVFAKIFQSFLSFGMALMYQRVQNKIYLDFSADMAIKSSLAISVIIFALFVFMKRNQKITIRQK